MQHICVLAGFLSAAPSTRTCELISATITAAPPPPLAQQDLPTYGRGKPSCVREMTIV